MIRVYSCNFTKEDYEKISEIFYHGLRVLAPLSHCSMQSTCHECEHYRVCTAIMKASDYCDKKAQEMAEP